MSVMVGTDGNANVTNPVGHVGWVLSELTPGHHCAHPPAPFNERWTLRPVASDAVRRHTFCTIQVTRLAVAVLLPGRVPLLPTM